MWKKVSPERQISLISVPSCDIKLLYTKTFRQHTFICFGN